MVFFTTLINSFHPLSCRQLKWHHLRSYSRRLILVGLVSSGSWGAARLFLFKACEFLSDIRIEGRAFTNPSLDFAIPALPKSGLVTRQVDLSISAPMQTPVSSPGSRPIGHTALPLQALSVSPKEGVAQQKCLTVESKFIHSDGNRGQ